MFRPPKRWLGSGGAYDLEGYRQNQTLYANPDPAIFRRIGDISLFLQPTPVPIEFAPTYDSLVYTTQSNMNTWPTVEQLSFQTIVNRVNKTSDILDGALQGRTFVLRCTISDSSLSFTLNGYNDIRASTTDITNFDVDPADESARESITVLTLFPQFVTSVGVPIPGAPYEFYWYDRSANSNDMSLINLNPVLSNSLSTISNYKTTIETYKENYKITIDAINYSSMISTGYIENAHNAFINMGVSTGRYSTTYATYSTLYEKYISSFSTYTTATDSVSSLSTTKGISTPILEGEYAILKPEYDTKYGDYLNSTIRYDVALSSIFALSTSVQILSSIRDVFRAQTKGNAISTLQSIYPNLSSILQNMTGDPSLYMRGGGDPIPESSLYANEFQAQYISSLIQLMIDEKDQSANVSTLSSIWWTELQEKLRRTQALDTLRTSTTNIYDLYLSTSKTLRLYEWQITSSNTQIAATAQISTLNAKKIELNDIVIQIALYEQNRLQSNRDRITMCDNILSLIATGTSDTRTLFTDIIPNQYAPAATGSNVPTTAWGATALLEVFNPVSIWKTRDFSTLLAAYGTNVPIYFKYSNYTFSIVLNSTDTSTTQDATIRILRQATNEWASPDPSTELPMSIDTIGASPLTYTYKTLQVELLSAVLWLISYSTAKSSTGDFGALRAKYGIMNWISFLLDPAASQPYRLRFLSENDASIEIQAYRNNTWGPVGSTDFATTAALSMFLDPFVPALLLSDATTIQKEYYYDILNKNFSTNPIYFIYTIPSSPTPTKGLYKMTFTDTETASTRSIVLQQYSFASETFDNPTDPLPIGAPFSIQITVGTVSSADINTLKDTLSLALTGITIEHESLIAKKSALETELQTLRTDSSTAAVVAWGTWVETCIRKEAETFQDMRQLELDISSAITRYRISSAMEIPDSYIEEKRISTLDAYQNQNNALLRTYTEKVSDFYSLETQLQETIANLKETDSDIRINQQRCIEARSLWSDYLREYANLSEQYSSLTQRRSTLAIETGRQFVPSPEIPIILTLDTLGTSTCDYINQISDISYTVQTGGDYIQYTSSVSYTSTMSAIIVASSTLSTTTRTISSVNDTQDILKSQAITLEQFAILTNLMDTYNYTKNKSEFDKYVRTVAEISSQTIYSISKRRKEIITATVSSQLELASTSLIAMRNFRSQLSEFMTAITNEQSYLLKYNEYIADYNKQQYLWKAQKPGAKSKDALASIAASIDVGAATCNSFVKYRQQLFASFNNTLQIISTNNYFDSESIGPLYDTYVISTTTNPPIVFTLEPRLPLQMDFTYVSTSKTYFVPGGVIPPPIPACTQISSGLIVPVARAAPIDPTTTADLRNCGIKAQFVDFTNLPGGNFDGIQIQVIDKTGRNVALRKPVFLYPSSVPDNLKSAAQVLTDGAAYSSELTQRFITTTQTFVGSGLSTIRIDLSMEYEVAVVRVMRTTLSSTYNTSQINVSLLSSSMAQIAQKPFVIDAPTIIVDFRPSASSMCPVAVQRTRYGTCGTMARYVRLYPPNPFPSFFQFQLAEIVVLNSLGQNIALNKNVKLFINNTFSQDIVFITAGRYSAQPPSKCLQLPVPSNTYLEIDLGTEYDITAVHFHNMLTNGTPGVNLLNIRIRLYTEDFLQAGNDALVLGNRRREVVSFLKSGVDVNCSTELRWPSYYGTAGIIASGIRVVQQNPTALRFGTLKVIDRAGRNCALFRDVDVGTGTTNTNPKKQLAVQEADFVSDIAEPFVSSASTAGQYAKITFDTPPIEICAIYLYGPSVGGASFLNGLRIDILDATGATITSFAPNGQDEIAFFDTRINPDISKFPTTETAPIVRYGQFGLYAQSIVIAPLLPSPSRISSEFITTDSMGNTRSYTIAFQGLQTLYKTADYDLLKSRFGTTPFYFALKSKTFRLTFGSTETDSTRAITLELYSNGAWAPATDTDIASTNTANPTPTVNPISILVFTNPSNAINGWLLSNICITDGTGKSILPLISKSYKIQLASLTTTQKLYNYDTLLYTYPENISLFTFMYNYKVFRATFHTTEDAQTKATQFEIDRTGTNIWELATTSDLPIGIPIVIDVFLNGASAYVNTQTQTLTIHFNRAYEVNAVLLHASEFAGQARSVSLVDCGGKQIANTYSSGNSVPYMNMSWFPADFRRRKINDNYSGPIVPYPVQYGLHNTGVLARYIEIIPKDATTPLYISQIIAVNACGRNVAFNKDTYTANRASPTAQGPELAVDGVYQDELTPTLAQTIIYDSYIPKPESNSFKSGTGTGTRFIIDMGRFVQKWNPATFILSGLDNPGLANINYPSTPIFTLPATSIQLLNTGEPVFILNVSTIQYANYYIMFMVSASGVGKYYRKIGLPQPIFDPNAWDTYPTLASLSVGPPDLVAQIRNDYQAGSRKISACKNEVSNSACQITAGDQYTYNQEINSIIFVAPIGRAVESTGVIVRLLDANGDVVGIQKVTSIVQLFGVDFLDFRRDQSRNLALDLVEEPQTKVEAIGCGVMAQYVRVEQASGSTDPIQMSQLYVVDINNRNVALYKPTTCYDTSGSLYDLSYRAVDGIYYVKGPNDGYMSKHGIGKYLEVNLGCPTPVAKVWIVNLNTGNSERDLQRMSNMRIKLYSGSRDIITPIAVQTPTSSAATASNPSGVGTLTLAKSGDAKTIDIIGVSAKVGVFMKKYSLNLVPVKPNIDGIPTTTAQYMPLVLSPNCGQDLTLDISRPFTIGANRGIPTYFIRIYNPMSYIQISQLLIFDGAGTNITRIIPASKIFATNSLPDSFPERAVDGYGGFFHVNRPDNQSFISEKKRYEYWQIQVADITAATGVEIIGLKYFPPKVNRLRNIGMRFQLLDKSQNVLSQYVLKEGDHAANEFWVDFRIRGPNPLPPLVQYCFPRIETIVSGLGGPFGITGDEDGTIFFTDQVAGKVYSLAYTNATDTFAATPTPLFSTESPYGIIRYFYSEQNQFDTVVCIPSGFYVASVNQSAEYPPNYTGPAYTIIENYNYGQATSYQNGVDVKIVNTSGTSIYNLNTPTGLAFRIIDNIKYLYVACRNDFCIRAYRINTENATVQEDPSKQIGVMGQQQTGPIPLAESPDRIQFKAPTGLAVDDNQNLYIADEGTGTIYITAPDTSSFNRSMVYRLAGTGVSGFSELLTQPATECMLNRPQNLFFHKASGDLLVADFGNGRIRRIRVGSKQRISIPQNPTAPPVYTTTTLAQAGPDPNVPAATAFYKTQTRDRETIREFKAPARIEMLD